MEDVGYTGLKQAVGSTELLQAVRFTGYKQIASSRNNQDGGVKETTITLLRQIKS